MTSATAFSIDFLVMMSRGLRFVRIASTSTRADSAAESAFSPSGDAICDEPSRLMPSASNEDDIVFAVYWPPQAPTDGQAFFSMPSKSPFDILPAASAPTASKGETMVSFCPFQNPGLMVPAYTKMPGTLMRAIAITLPGMFLSQPPTQITPSISWPFTAVSIASAITSRETSEYFIPSVPMPIPSVTVGKPNACGIAPAAFTAARTRSTRGWMPALQGFMVEWPFATPTIALSKSPSPKPTARSIARLGERASPWVMVLLLQLSAMGKTPNAENQLRFACILLESAPQPFMLVHPNFDPVAISLGPIAIRWYGIMYLVGFAVAFWLGRLRIARAKPERITTSTLDDLLFFCVLGVVLGGRLGYVLFYKPAYYFSNPLETLAVWHGGMSFHGGFLGVLVALWYVARRHRLRWLELTDFFAPLAPLAFAAGRLLFVILWIYSARPRPAGAVSGAFLLGYGVFRFTAEYFREPDDFLGLLALDLSMGQWLRSE